MTRLSRGEVARAASVNIETLRYYERRELLPKPPRTAANYRSYPADAVQRVRFIKRAQALGFSLQEIRELLSLRAAPGSNCEPIRERARAKLAAIGERIESLESMRSALLGLVDTCSGKGPMTSCSILDAIDDEELEQP